MLCQLCRGRDSPAGGPHSPENDRPARGATAAPCRHCAPRRSGCGCSGVPGTRGSRAVRARAAATAPGAGKLGHICSGAQAARRAPFWRKKVAYFCAQLQCGHGYAAVRPGGALCEALKLAKRAVSALFAPGGRWRVLLTLTARTGLGRNTTWPSARQEHHRWPNMRACEPCAEATGAACFTAAECVTCAHAQAACALEADAGATCAGPGLRCSRS